MELYYDSIGCGCCIDGDEPTWDDIEKQLRVEIAQEIEDTECQVGKGCECVCKGLDLAAAIVRKPNANL